MVSPLADIQAQHIQASTLSLSSLSGPGEHTLGCGRHQQIRYLYFSQSCTPSLPSPKEPRTLTLDIILYVSRFPPKGDYEGQSYRHRSFRHQ